MDQSSQTSENLKNLSTRQVDENLDASGVYVMLNGKIYLAGAPNFVPLPSDSDDELDEESSTNMEVTVFQGPHIVGHNGNIDPHTLYEIISGVLGLIFFALVIPLLLIKFWL